MSIPLLPIVLAHSRSVLQNLRMLIPTPLLEIWRAAILLG